MSLSLFGLFLFSALEVAAAEPVPASSPPSQVAAPAAAAAPEPPPRVLVLDLAARNIDEGTARLATGIISATADEDARFTVDTVADLRAMANVEGAKAQLGCDVDSCLAEMAQAMGSRFVFHGDVGALGDLLVINLNLYDAVSAQSVARRSLQAQGPAALPGVLKPAVAAMLGEALPKGAGSPKDEAATTQATPSADRPWLRPSTVVLGAGATLGLAGGVVAGVAEVNVSRPLRAPDGSSQPWRAAGVVALAVGVVGLVTAGVGGIMLAMEDEGATP